VSCPTTSLNSPRFVTATLTALCQETESNLRGCTCSRESRGYYDNPLLHALRLLLLSLKVLLPKSLGLNVLVRVALAPRLLLYHCSGRCQ
jgi:hypothetical protein